MTKQSKMKCLKDCFAPLRFAPLRFARNDKVCSHCEGALATKAIYEILVKFYKRSN
jgi:hypothetical protein